MLKKLVLLVFASMLFAVVAVAQGSDATKSATTTAATGTPKPAAFRPTKDQIKQGQEVLIKEKLYTGQATGVYGDSRDAIKAYQKANGLDVNGKFDRATLGKMGIALTDKQNGIATTTASSSTKTSTTKTTTTTTSDGPKRPAPFQATNRPDQAVAAKADRRQIIHRRSRRKAQRSAQDGGYEVPGSQRFEGDRRHQRCDARENGYRTDRQAKGAGCCTVGL